MTSREDILARVRAAVGSGTTRTAASGAAVGAGTTPQIAREYRQVGEYPPGDPALVALLADRLTDYRATVHRTDDVAGVVRAVLGATPSLAVPAGVPASWLPDGVTVLAEGDATPGALDQVDSVLTGCAVAIAETGTIVLDAGPGQGPRVLTLLPDVHLCVISADQVVQTVPEALARIGATRPLTFISGPSATSDIELQRVEGVHGPRTLHVVLTSTHPLARTSE